MYSKPAVKTLLPFCLGVVVARTFSPGLIELLVCQFALAAGAIFWVVFLKKGASIVFLIALVLAGGLRYKTATYLSSDHLAVIDVNAGLSRIFCKVVDYPDLRDTRTLVTVEVFGIARQGSLVHCSGKVLLSLDKEICAPTYGDVLAVDGELRLPMDRRNPGGFDYRAYLQSQDIYRTMFVRFATQIATISRDEGNWFLRELVFPVKGYLDEYITRSYPEDEAALLRGLLVGERGQVGPDLIEAFSDLGVIHILAVSGLHVGFVVLILVVLASVFRVPYNLSAWLTILGLVLFCCLTNLKPPVIRASIMAAVLLFSGRLERKTDTYNTLAFAAILILLWRPQELFLPGFQLSFSAVLSIVYFYPKLYIRWPFTSFARNRILRYPGGLAAVSIAAFLGTVPCTIIYFQKLPLLSVVSNLVVIPLTFLSVAGCYLAAIVNLISPFLAKLYGNFARLSIHLMIEFVQWCAGLPFTHFDVYGIGWLHLLFYVAVILMIFDSSPGTKKACCAGALVILNLLVWRGVLDDENEMTITFIDVGQGDAVLLSMPGDRHILYDAGPRNPYFDAGEIIVAAYLRRMGIRRLEAVIVSHADSDHLGGVPYILSHFQVGAVWDNGQGKETRLYSEYLALIDSLAIPRRVLRAGEVIRDFEPVLFFTVHPSEPFLAQHGNQNESSLAFKLTYGETDVLLLGDVELDGERHMSGYGAWLQSELMKANHHGSNTSNSTFLIEYTQPKIVVASAGERNKFGHPSEEVLARFRHAGATVFRTDVDAAVVLTTDGMTLRRVDWQ
jgi:competence protein ComEC